MPDSSPVAVYDCETYLKIRRAYLEAEIARLKPLGAGMKPAELRSHLAMLRELERELGEVMVRGHTLSHSPVSQQRITMANRTITSLMIANGAALGVIGAGLFESSQPGLVIHHLLGPALIFLAGLLAAGAIQVGGEI